MSDEVADWWATSVSRMAPGEIELRGRPVQDLIGTTSLASMIWLMLRGDLPRPGQAALLEAALVAGVDRRQPAGRLARRGRAAVRGAAHRRVRRPGRRGRARRRRRGGARRLAGT